MRAVLTMLLFVPLAASAAPHWRAAARPNSFEHAQRLREALEGRPEQQRTQLAYERVLDAYRAIYHGNPASPKADASIVAVADLLAEEGRVFQDEKAFRDAIGQYEFLRREYPLSPYRSGALLTQGEIYQRDLGDLKRARAVYEGFLRQYPQSALAVEARVELRTIRRDEIAGRLTNAGRRPGTVLRAAIQSQEEPVSRRRRESAQVQAPEPRTASEAATAQLEESDIPPPLSPTPAAPPPADNRQSRAVNRSAGDIHPADGVQMDAEPLPASRGRLPLITGIRHWSTPEYTRVAIDLQREVRYQAARVPRPDRIFFDLYGVRLSPELEGRSVEVIDDGFLSRIRAAQFSPNITRIVLDVNSVSEYSAFFLSNPPRLIIDVHGRRGSSGGLEAAASQPPPAVRPAVGPSFVTEVPPPARPAEALRAGVFPDAGVQSPLADVATLSSQPNQVRATRHPTTAPIVASVSAPDSGPQPGSAPRSLPRTGRPVPQPRSADALSPAEADTVGVQANAASAQRLPTSMVRALGLKINRIVIDAGHGGHDSGTLGPAGLEEKDVVLDVALRLGSLLKQRLGADVIYTRTDDTFIPLETRTAIANQAQADLFISVHANSSSDPETRGVETYYLNFTSSADALEVAARENSVSDESIHQLSDLVKKIALQDKINESREFASDVEESLYSGLEQGNPGLKDRGVKKAPFVVLIGANMPSILAEISFLTNPEDAQELRRPAYRERIAEALYRGVARYVSSLNGVRVAQAGSRPSASE